MSGNAALRGLHLHFDCASGVAGDMTLGALIDLGVPVEVIGDALDAIGAGRWRLRVERVMKRGIAAVDVKVDTERRLIGLGVIGGDRSSVPSPSPSPPAHSHHLYSAIRARIEAAALTDGTRRRALDIFDRIARAEAKLHGSSVDDVAFHEVGAIDSIVDVVGTAAGLDWLAPASASCTGVAMGSGTLTCAHGILPVPAPAALEIMRLSGGIMTDGGLPREMCTPTGAAIVAATVTRWTPAPPGRPVAVGWGAGDADFPDRANALRLVVLEPTSRPAPSEVFEIAANVDDMSPELCGPALDAVFAAGAVDAWWTPITMKKGRPALLLTALADAASRDAVIAAILRETTTIGVRFSARDRVVLARRVVEVSTPYGAIPVKVAAEGDTVRNAAPEFEACAAAARAHGVPVKAVFAAAIAAYFAPPCP